MSNVNLPKLAEAVRLPPPPPPQSTTPQLIPAGTPLPARNDATVQPPATSLLSAIEQACLNESALDALDIRVRRALMGDWFREGDLGYIFGLRGGGKTWLELYMAKCLSEGRVCGPWAVPEAVKCLIVDGEMPMDEMRRRIRALRGCPGNNLIFLSHQRFFDLSDASLCLTDHAKQEALTQYCVNNGIKVVFFDNLSTLFTGVEENKADDWRDYIEGWLLELRRRGIAVVIVAHAGRNGMMRGTSQREDCAFWQIALEPLEKEGEGARFRSRFTKNRNAPTDPASLKWHFKPEGDRISVTYTAADTLQLFRECVRDDGINTCSEIAEALGLSNGQVSKMAKKAEQAGWLTIQNREYSYRDPVS